MLAMGKIFNVNFMKHWLKLSLVIGVITILLFLVQAIKG
jgi:hypothetical protein